MQIFPILFSSIISMIILNSYISNAVALVVPVLFCVSMIFRFCTACKTQNLRSRYAIVFLIVSVLTAGLLFANTYDISFYSWIFIKVSGFDYTSYFIVLFIFCFFYVSSAVFYFTYIIYRPPFLLMVLLIAYAVNDKRYVEVSPVYTVLAICLFFMVILFHGNRALKNSVQQLSKKILFGFSCVTILVTSLSFLISIPEETLAPPLSINSANQSLEGLFRRQSFSGRSDENLNNDQILFLVNAEEPIYFIRQVFNNYDGSRWHSVTDDYLNTGYYSWEEPASLLNYDNFFRYLQELSNDPDYPSEIEPYLDNIQNLTNIEQLKYATIYPQGFPTTFILAPIRTTRVSGLPNGISCIRDKMDEIFITDRRRISSSYTVTYYSDAFRNNPDLQNFAKQFDANQFDSFLLSAYFASSETSEETFSSFWNESQYAGHFARASAGTESETIKNLAAQITADKSGDYEKALALERYFTENNYQYDQNRTFREQNENIEYFLFESKSGTCGHYATAMTLMAQSAGLTARYVEGFISAEQNGQGYYVIRAKHSHAFVQIFIPGYGWVTFDPTVAGGPASEGGPGQFFGQLRRIFTDTTLIIFTIFTAVILLGLIGYFIYVHILSEKIFRRTVKKSAARRGILLLYNRVLKILKQKDKMNNIPPAALCRSVRSTYGINIEVLTDCFERAFFGDPAVMQDILPEEKEEALDIYARLYEKVRKT